jgi:DNA-binding response OmpR family regulator
MNGSFDERTERPANDPEQPAADAAPRTPSRQVRVIGADQALFDLLSEWLGAMGWIAVAADLRDENSGQATYDLVIVDIPTPRNGANERLHRIACDHPGTPVLALSAHFFQGVERSGGVARSLGVACVLPKPLSRESLVHAVRTLLRR